MALNMKRLFSILFLAVVFGARAATFDNVFTTQANPQNANINWNATNSTFAATMQLAPSNVYNGPGLMSSSSAGILTCSSPIFGVLNIGDGIQIPTNSAGGAGGQLRIYKIIDANDAYAYSETFPTIPTGVTYTITPGALFTTDNSGFHNPHIFTLWSGGITSEGTFWSECGPNSFNNGPFGGGFDLVDADTSSGGQNIYRYQAQAVNGVPWNGDHLIVWKNITFTSSPGFPWIVDPNAPNFCCAVLADGTIGMKGETNIGGTTLTMGNMISFQGETNKPSGQFVLNGSTTVNVGNTLVTATTKIIMTEQSANGGTQAGNPFVTGTTPGTGFAVKGTAADTSIVFYTLVNTNL